MKIPLEKLEPNPHRDPAKYPFDQERLEGLRTSIQETGFWDNLLVRPAPNNEGRYQIAYGHHRLLIATEELGPNYKADVPVKKISDADMLKIMVQENETMYPHDPVILRENLLATKRFFETPEGQEVYAKLKKEVISGASTATDKYRMRSIERRIYATFLGLPEIRVRTGLKLIKINNPELEQEAKNLEHARAIAESPLAEDKETAIDLAKIAKEQDLSRGDLRAVVKVVAATDKEHRPKILQGVKKRPQKTVTAPDAARKAQIEAVSESEPVLPEAPVTFDADTILNDYTRQLRIMNVGIHDLFELWPHLDREARQEFCEAVNDLFKTISNHIKEVKK